jgi:CheY-like chemotaxis protein
MSQNNLVLVVEDSHLLQKVAITHLKRIANVDIHLASNGEEAVNAARNHKYALILMDIQMPIMDGLTAATEIRKIQAQRGYDCPIVAITASTSAMECLSAGMDDWFSKPAKFDYIIQRWLPQCRKEVDSGDTRANLSS